MNKKEIKELINSIEERLIVSQEINEPINTDLDKAIRLSVAYEELQQENKKCEEVIDKATNDIQQLIDDTKNKTVISLGQFIPKLEVIQDELNGSNDILKEVE